MTDLTDAIDAFLAKYPSDAVLEWRDKPRKRDALDVIVTDLVTAGERWRTRTSDPGDDSVQGRPTPGSSRPPWQSTARPGSEGKR